MESTAIFNKLGNLLTGNGMLVGTVDCEDSAWVIPQPMQMAYYSYSRSDASITALDVLVNGIVIDSIAVDSDKGTGAIDLPVLEGDELCVVNSGAGQTIQDCIVVIAFSDAIPFDPTTPLYELTLQIFYDITGVSYAKYIENSPKVLHKRGLNYLELGELAWKIADQIAQGAKLQGA